MTTFDPIQMPTLACATSKALPPVSQNPAPDGAATEAFRRAYERPAGLSPVPRETLGSAVRESLALAQALPQPVELPRAAAEALLESPLPAARPASLPPATRETLGSAVRENLALAQALPQPVELPRAAAEAPEEASPAVDRSVAQSATVVPSKRAEKGETEEGDVLQALPTAVGALPSGLPDAGGPSAVPVSGVAANVSAEMPRTASGLVLEAASAVADALLVSPNLMNGDGDIVVRLKPDVLDGSQLRIQVAGREMRVEFEPTTADVARLLTESQTQLVDRLAERLPAFAFVVAVRTVNPAGRLARRTNGDLEGLA